MKLVEWKHDTCAIFAADGGDGGRGCGEPGHLGRGQLQQQQGRGHRGHWGLGMVTLILTTGVTLGEVTLLLTGEVAFLLGGQISFLLGGKVSFLCGRFVCCCGCCRSYCCCCSFLGPLRRRVLKAGRKCCSVINLRAAAISCCIVTGRGIAAGSSIFAVTSAGESVVQVLHPVLALIIVCLGPGLREVCPVHLAQDVVKHGSGH